MQLLFRGKINSMVSIELSQCDYRGLFNCVKTEVLSIRYGAILGWKCSNRLDIRSINYVVN